MLIQRFNSLGRVAVLVVLSATTAPAQAQQSSTPSFSKPQLEQLVAPIALHPDPLLSQILMASTYPTEVVQAARWVRENASVTGQALQDAMQKQPWDPSVKALTAVPQTLQMMSDKLDWTQQLGDAFLGQQAELLAAVQVLRQRAEAAGHLKSTDQQKVSKASKTIGSTTTSVITIEPTNPDYVYVPIYDPRVCYGDWPYPAYEPFYWYPYGFTGSGIVAFAGAIAVGSALWGRVDWWRDRVNINVNRFNQFNRTNMADGTWRHDARHRGNVPYRDAKVAGQFAMRSEPLREKPTVARPSRVAETWPTPRPLEQAWINECNRPRRVSWRRRRNRLGKANRLLQKPKSPSGRQLPPNPSKLADTELLRRDSD
jgi:hypothetical protein